jgi:hypothetical protein
MMAAITRTSPPQPPGVTRVYAPELPPPVEVVETTQRRAAVAEVRGAPATSLEATKRRHSTRPGTALIGEVNSWVTVPETPVDTGRSGPSLSVATPTVGVMKDLGDGGSRTGGATVTVLPSAAEVLAFAHRLTRSGDHLDDPARIDLIAALETLKCAAEATQAEVTADFDHSQRAVAAARGVPTERQGRGIAEQVALARRESPHRGKRHLGLARILRTELPCTRAAFRAGRVGEWTVTVLARETACLSLEHRMLVDEAVAGDPDRLSRMSVRDLAGEVLDLSCRLDPAAVAKRRRSAEADRHTTLRPAPDVMTWFGALLPVKDGVAVHRALLAEAGRRKAAGDPRSRGAIMADTLVQRVLAPCVEGLGPSAGTPTGPLLSINIVVPDTVLLGDGESGGFVEGYGPVPGDLLREWIAEHAETGVADWVCRLYTAPATGALVAMDAKGDRFEGRLADYLRLRDRICRTPGCGAPIRHLDHAHDRARGGPTSALNGQGLCEGCNHAKQAHGWRVRPIPGALHTVEITTPTGHRYTSRAPAHAPPPSAELQARPTEMTPSGAGLAMTSITKRARTRRRKPRGRRRPGSRRLAAGDSAALSGAAEIGCRADPLQPAGTGQVGSPGVEEGAAVTPAVTNRVDPPRWRRP